jgi:hypothetical protein
MTSFVAKLTTPALPRSTGRPLLRSVGALARRTADTLRAAEDYDRARSVAQGRRILDGTYLVPRPPV